MGKKTRDVIALLIVVGLVIGLAIGSLGGGSIIAVPVLVYLFHQGAAEATTGSLVVVGITAALGAFAHRRSGRVHLRTGLLFGVLGVAGSYVGSRLSVAVPDAVLLGLFSALLGAVAVLMARRLGRAPAVGPDEPVLDELVLDGPMPDGPTPDEPAPLGPAPAESAGGRWARPSRRRLVVLVATATAIGGLTGFFGVGGGFAVVPALVLVVGLPMPAAVGTSLVVIGVNSASALASRAGQPVDLDVGLIAAFTVTAVIGSLLGVRVAGRVSPARLSAAFTVLIALIAVYTAVRSVLALS